MYIYLCLLFTKDHNKKTNRKKGSYDQDQPKVFPTYCCVLVVEVHNSDPVCTVWQRAADMNFSHPFFYYSSLLLLYSISTSTRLMGIPQCAKKKTKIRNCCPQNARVCCLSIVLWRQQLDPLALLESRVGFGYRTRK